MHEDVLHILDVHGPKKEGSDKDRLAMVEHEIFKCQGTVEHGLSANHYTITDFIQENEMDTKNMGEALFKLQEQIENHQAQIFDLQSQNYEYELRFKRMSIAADFRVPESSTPHFKVVQHQIDGVTSVRNLSSAGWNLLSAPGVT
ncbi:40s ribosomal protein s5-1 [Hordeum vulgare]|nr:40s ribosomal protein s5-1 [Hordeum vulgare]